MYEYSRKWRFLFNPNKCHLIIISPKKPPTGISVKFGPTIINQTESITHVGIELRQSLKRSSAHIQKGRASLFSVLAIDRDTSFISPSILAFLVENVCFPEFFTVLNYGLSDINKLEKFIRLTAKSIQRFPTSTRTDIALGMLGWLPIMSYIK